MQAERALGAREPDGDARTPVRRSVLGPYGGQLFAQGDDGWPDEERIVTSAQTPPAPPNETAEQKLDREMGELGLTRTPRFGGKYIWKGERHGRQWTVAIQRESRTKYSGEIRRRQWLGWRVRLEGSTSLMTRLFLVPRKIADSSVMGWIYRLKKQVVIEPSPPLHDERVVAVDEAYARRFATSREALEVAAVLSLQESSSGGPGSSVYFGPERIYFASARLQGGEVSVPQIAEWVEQAHQLATRAEALGPPSKPSKVSWLERTSRDNPMKGALAVIAVLGCSVTLAGLLFSGFLMAVAFVLSRGG